MFVFYYIFLISFKLVSAYDRGGHNSDIQVESYQYGDYFFNFYFVEANWNEAFAICKASSSRLAVVHNMERANFLAETLSHTIVGVEDVWIGARFTADSWQWVPIRRLLPSDTVDGFPPWLNYPTKRGKYCLSLDRKNHSTPIFVELQCFLQRPFICEKSSVAQLTVKPTLTTKVKINMSTFSVYYGRVTWEESLTFCKQTGSRLAVIPNIEIANQLVTIMHHLRPVIRNAWIGARKQNYGWIWTSTDKVLPREKDIENDYPPWANEDYKNDYVFKDCLVLDHHVCKSTKFQGNYGIEKTCIEKSIFFGDTCTLKKDFICESVPQEKKLHSDELEVIMAGQIKYIFSKERQSWKSAAQICNSLNMVLAMPANKWELDAIMSNLVDVEFAWDHIWLGAKWDIIHNQWEWVNKTGIPINATYLPWCKSLPVHEDQQNCLNLDRDAHKIPIVYGFNCSIPQGFVCQFMSEDELPLSENSELRTYVVNYFLVNHADAEEACQFHKSHLAVTNTMELAQQLSLILPVDTLAWVGGERINSIWQWTRSKEIIPDTSDSSNYPPWGNTTTFEGKVCLAVQSGFRRYPQFMEVPCETPLFFACEIDAESLPKPDVIITHDDNTYYFFRQPETWNKANSYCTYSHLHLPKIGNIELANFISEITGDEHPWWVGAKLELNDTWQWTSTGEKISNKIINTSWFDTNHSIKEVPQCLVLLDRTNVKKFRGKKCEDKYGFICVNYHIGQQDMVKQHGIELNIKQNLANIMNARKYCEEQEMAVMNITKNIRVTKAIMQEKKIKSLWMDIVRTHQGKWIYEDTNMEFFSTIKFPDKNKTYESGVTKDCAMLVLKADAKLEIRRSDCNDFSFTLCQKTAATKGKDDITLEDIEMTISSALKLIASLDGRTYLQAKHFCEDLGGAIIDESLYTPAIQFFKTLAPKFRNLWLGKNTTRKALQSNIFIDEAVTERLIPLQQKNELCLAYNRTDEVKRSLNCTDKLSTMCFIDLKPCQAPPTVDDLEWSPKSCKEGNIDSGKVCKATCLKGNLFGPEKLACIKGNWKHRSYFITTSKCLSTNNQSQVLLDFLLPHTIKNHKPRIPFLFAVDNSAPEFLFKISISLIKHIVNIVLLNERRQTAVIMYSKQVQTALDFFAYDTCDFTEKLKFMMFNKHSLPSNYFKVLDSINNLLKTKKFRETILIFFALRKDAGPVTERINIIEELRKRGVIIIVLAVRNAVERTVLEEMASMYNGDLQLYLFKDKKALQECGNFLQQHENPAVKKCIFKKQARP